MRYPSLKSIEKLAFSQIPSEELFYYAYAIHCCQIPASVVSGEWYQRVDDLCKLKIAELRDEISCRVSSEFLNHALAILDEDVDLANMDWSNPITFTQFSVVELIELYSMSKFWYDMRRSNKMEVFTRGYQWRIVYELLNRKDGNALAEILLLAECIEADNNAHNLKLSYKIGEKPKTFVASEYQSDEDLVNRIYALSENADYVSREELIQIADYIQLEIVEKGETGKYLDVINAIVCTGLPCFDYPDVLRSFESAIEALAKSRAKKDIDLAPYYYNLWSLTLKPTYLRRFEKIVRQCYLTLAKNKHYPNLGVNVADSASIATALRFLVDYRHNVWILNENYDVERLLAKYKTA